jgi:hypothetical protein
MIGFQHLMKLSLIATTGLKPGGRLEFSLAAA